MWPEPLQVDEGQHQGGGRGRRLARDVGGAPDVEAVDGLSALSDGRVEVRHGDLGHVEGEALGGDDGAVADAIGAVVQAAAVPLALVLVLGEDLLWLRSERLVYDEC